MRMQILQLEGRIEKYKQPVQCMNSILERYKVWALSQVTVLPTNMTAWSAFTVWQRITARDIHCRDVHCVWISFRSSGVFTRQIDFLWSISA